MSYPGFIRRLFANEGADPLLRKEIIPFGDTEGTVCEGSDGAPWDGGGEATPWPDMPAA